MSDDNGSSGERRQHAVDIAVIRESVRRMESELVALRKDVNGMHDTMQRWRAAIWILGVLGGILAWALTSWHQLIRLFGGGSK